MPFTLSHAAAAAPLSPVLRRLRLPLAGVAIGAMSPDFEYFIRLQTLGLWGHSFVGLFVFCLPAGLVVLAGWELLAREPALDLLGLCDDRRVERRDPTWLGRAVVAILIGAATHVFWDSFTHAGRWGVRHMPELEASAATVNGRPLPWFIVLDHASTIVGEVVVVGWLARRMWAAGAFRVIARSAWRWSVFAALALASMVLGLWNGSRQPPVQGYWTVELWLAQVAVGAQAGLGLAVVAFSVAYRLATSDTAAATS